MIAYKAASPVGLAALNRVQTSGFIAEFDLPGDIYVFNISGQQTALVAGQPDDASLFVEGAADRAIVRSTPAWSPDGTTLAWTEFDFGSAALRLVLYDFGTRTQRVAADGILVEIVMGSAPSLRWGAGGIAVIGDRGDPLIYSPEGTPLSAPELILEEDEAPMEHAWIDANGHSLFGILYSSGRWVLIDPSTGREQAINGVPLMIGTAENSLALHFGTLPGVGMFWETIDPTGATVASGAFPAPPSRVTLSPSGREVAFIGYPDYSGVAIWHDGEVIPIPGTGGDTLAAGTLLWGETMWRVGVA
jgi:hypothetical protein